MLCIGNEVSIAVDSSNRFSSSPWCLTTVNHQREQMVCRNEETTVAGVFGIGDAVDGVPELTPSAIQAGRLLAMRLFGGEKTEGRGENLDLLIPLVTSFQMSFVVGDCTWCKHTVFGLARARPDCCPTCE